MSAPCLLQLRCELSNGDVRWVTYAPDATHGILIGAGLKDGHVEAMADAVRRGGNTGDSGADDGNLGPAELIVGLGRARRERVGDDGLDELVEEQQRVKEEVDGLRLGSHLVVNVRGDAQGKESWSRGLRQTQMVTMVRQPNERRAGEKEDRERAPSEQRKILLAQSSGWL